jgi:hypothetical protein
MSAVEGDQSAQTNRRVETRYPREAVPAITALRLSPGDDAFLVNISASGILVESAMRYAPGVTLTVFFEGALATPHVRGRVVRCQVSAITRHGALQYQTALSFEHRLELGIQSEGPDDSPTTPDDSSDPSEPFNRW